MAPLIKHLVKRRVLVVGSLVLLPVLLSGCISSNQIPAKDVPWHVQITPPKCAASNPYCGGGMLVVSYTDFWYFLRDSDGGAYYHRYRQPMNSNFVALSPTTYDVWHKLPPNLCYAFIGKDGVRKHNFAMARVWYTDGSHEDSPYYMVGDGVECGIDKSP